jgi:hypothetical protein
MKRFILSLCVFVFAAFTLSGCAIGNFGKASMSSMKMDVPPGLSGKDKEQVLRQLGVPDAVTMNGPTEYWSFHNTCGYYVLLFGKTLDKDLVLDFRDGRVASSFLVDKGQTMGLLSSQSALTR